MLIEIPGIPHAILGNRPVRGSDPLSRFQGIEGAQKLIVSQDPFIWDDILFRIFMKNERALLESLSSYEALKLHHTINYGLDSQFSSEGRDSLEGEFNRRYSNRFTTKLALVQALQIYDLFDDTVREKGF